VINYNRKPLNSAQKQKIPDFYLRTLRAQKQQLSQTHNSLNGDSDADRSSEEYREEEDSDFGSEQLERRKPKLPQKRFLETELGSESDLEGLNAQERKKLRRKLKT
jgi:hypothetical protein